MKIKALIIPVFLLFTIFNSKVYSQNTKAIIKYQGVYNVDIEKKLKKIPKKFKDRVRDTYKDMRPVDFTLLVKNEESIFKQNTPLNIENTPLNLASIIGQRGVFYINSNSNITIREKDVMGELYNISYLLDSISWKLTQDSKKIGEYVCYKAITYRKKITKKRIIKQEVLAWYSPEVPINHGPIGYAGLPGLIVELTVENFTYTLKKITLNTKKNIDIKKPTNGILVTQQEFYKVEQEVTESIFGN